MRESISDNKKSRGRPATTGTGTLIGVRLQSDLLTPLDAAGSEAQETRPETIRRIVRDWLANHGFLKP